MVFVHRPHWTAASVPLVFGKRMRPGGQTDRQACGHTHGAYFLLCPTVRCGAVSLSAIIRSEENLPVCLSALHHPGAKATVSGGMAAFAPSRDSHPLPKLKVMSCQKQPEKKRKPAPQG